MSPRRTPRASIREENPLMTLRSMASSFLLVLLATLGVACSTDSVSDSDTAPDALLPKPTFTADGALEQPVGYREWVYIGTPLTPNDLNPPEAAFPEFHNVYIHPDDFAHYSETGDFPDGTVIVKELVTVGSNAAVSGNGYFMGDFRGLETTIKDVTRFPDEPGNWAYFSFGHDYPLAETATAFPAAACNACHEASAADDWVFTQHYPILSAAKASGPASGGVLPKPAFNADGQLERAVGYREWVYIGTPLTPNALNPPEAPFPEFHNVYIHPDDFSHFEETGEFPDGTVIVKELVLVGATAAVSGNGYFMGEFAGLETTIKDSDRFADEPGNWAYFSYGHSYPLSETAPAFPAPACNACHEASAADDWVFTQYYPILRAARPGSDGAIATTAPAADPGGETADAAEVSGDDVIPTDAAELLTYLQDGRYNDFAAEAEAHGSVGPHPSPDLQASSTVRAFFNSAMEASIRAGNSVHPAGSGIVKEFRDADGGLSGWAVSVKTDEDSQNGQGWYWYEALGISDDATVIAAGMGVALCWGCHATGNDFVLSDYP